MNRRMRSAAWGLGVFGIGAALSGLATYPLFLRRQCLTWGARPDEVSRKLPGDELLPAAAAVARLFGMLVMEPGSLIMERKMLLGIKERAEDLAREQAESPVVPSLSVTKAPGAPVRAGQGNKQVGGVAR